VSADLSVLMELTDTSLLNLTSRFATKLNAADTASLSNRINAKGTGTVTSVGSGFGLLGGTITTTGTLRLDTTTIYARLQDSINVAIGGDTIKILKQEYQPALSSVLTWTITPKFPIQLKAYILVFRNGQLLNNDQYNLTDTNKITIVSTSFKIGANYTVATVSGIGSVGSAQAGNPVYPEAGIALSTGTTWASSIPNNSSNWNTAYNDKVNSLAVTGTTTKTITLTQQDGGTVLGNFTDNGSVTSVDMTVPTGLAISGQPITTSGTLALSYASGYAIPTDIKQNDWNTAYNDKINNAAFTGTDTKTLTLTQYDGGTFTPTFTDLQGVTGVTAGTGLTGGIITETGTLAVDTNFLVTRFDTSAMLLPYLRKADTTAMLLPYFRDADTTSLNLSSRFNTKVNLSDTLNMLAPYLRKADTTNMLLPYFRDADTTSLNLSSRFNAKVNLSDTLNMLSKYLRRADTTLMLLPYFRKADTTSLNLTSRFAAKQNILTNPVTGTGTTNNLPLFTSDSTLGNSVIQESSTNIGINTTPFASLTLGQGKNIMLDASSNNVPRLLFYETNARNENDVQFGAKIQYNSPSDRLEFVMRDSFSADPSGDELAISIVRQTGNVTIHKPTTLSSTLAVQGDITENGNNVLTSADTTTMLAPYIERGDTATMLNPYWRSGRFSGVLPIANGGTNANSASNARSNLNVDYLFLAITNGTVVGVSTNKVYIVNTGGSLTTQIDLTTDLTAGRTFMIKNLASGTIVSTVSNVIPLNGGSASTPILGAGNATPQWCTLVCDGTNWHIIQRN
jgi:hypothetical protein